MTTNVISSITGTRFSWIIIKNITLQTLIHILRQKINKICIHVLLLSTFYLQGCFFSFVFVPGCVCDCHSALSSSAGSSGSRLDAARRGGRADILLEARLQQAAGSSGLTHSQMKIISFAALLLD